VDIEKARERGDSCATLRNINFMNIYGFPFDLSSTIGLS
jgi:hypothetical protein